jgi:hypothetical protein
LVSAYFSKICGENASLIQVWQERPILHTKTFVHFWQRLIEFFKEWEILDIKFVEKFKTHFECLIYFTPNIVLFVR